MPLDIYIGSDTDIFWRRMQKVDANGALVNVNDATIGWTLYTKSLAGVKSAVSSGTGSFAYLTGSAGDYKATVPQSLALAAGRGQIDIAASGGGLTGRREIAVRFCAQGAQ